MGGVREFGTWEKKKKISWEIHVFYFIYFGSGGVIFWLQVGLQFSFESLK